MQDRVDAAGTQQPLQKDTVADIADDELGVARHRPVEAAGQVVENRYFLAALDEFPDHVAADESGAAGDKNAHCRTNPLTRRPRLAGRRGPLRRLRR
jgi:hypothetical protein